MMQTHLKIAAEGQHLQDKQNRECIVGNSILKDLYKKNKKIKKVTSIKKHKNRKT